MLVRRMPWGQVFRGRQHLAYQVWSEFVFGTTPESGEAKLCVGVEKGFFEETLLWMVELTNEREIESRLPFLN